MTDVDPYHGHGGTFVVLPDGTRVPSDPVTGEPLPPAASDTPVANPTTSDEE